MKLAEAIKINSSSRGESALRVYLACGFLPLHLATFLEAHLRQALQGHHIQIETGLFGDLAGNLDRFASDNAGLGAVVIEWEDLDRRLGRRSLGGWGPSLEKEILQDVANQVMRIGAKLKELSATKTIAVCLPTLALPPVSYQPAEQTSDLQLRLDQIVANFALDIAQSGCKVLNQNELNRRSITSERLDVKSELATGFPYHLSHASVLSEMLTALLNPASAKKGLITDLDDTLWRGLVGDDGHEAVSWSLDQQSHLHALYQQTLNALSESGVLIGVASKNDPREVQRALQREDLIVQADRLFPIEVHWQPKSESVGRILQKWNIAADSVIFVDDNPMELDEVSRAFPDIETRLFPKGDDAAGYAFLTALRAAFAKSRLAEEDSIRTESLRRADELTRHGVVAVDTDSFLEQLDAELTFEITNTADERAFDLLNKTNQFNLNGRRLTNAEFKSQIAAPNASLLTVTYKDKYGPLGKIAAVIGRQSGATFEVTNWVMSCRAFSRRIEHRTIEFLFQKLGVQQITFDFIRTDRNGPAQEFLSQIAGAPATDKVLLTQSEFVQRAPALSHKVRELVHA